MLEQFIGDKNVVSVIGPLEQKTSLGNDIIKVCFGDGTEEIMPKKRFELIVTEKQSDATTVQGKVCATTASMLHSVLMEYGVTILEMNTANNILSHTVQEYFDRAIKAKFGFDENSIPLTNVYNIVKDAESTTK